MTGGSPPCPCHSGSAYKRCCRPLHKGRGAPTPERLMRSRFSAYTLGLVRYILDTTHPDGPQFRADKAAWRVEVRAFCDQTRFVGLDIVETGDDGSDAWVTFAARLARDDREHILEERSRFRRFKGRWTYFAPWDS